MQEDYPDLNHLGASKYMVRAEAEEAMRESREKCAVRGRVLHPLPARKGRLPEFFFGGVLLKRPRCPRNRQTDWCSCARCSPPTCPLFSADKDLENTRERITPG